MSERKSGITKGQKLFFLFLLFLVLFTFPVLSIFNIDLNILGYPVLYIFLFVSWLVLIFLLYRAVDRNPNQKPTDE